MWSRRFLIQFPNRFDHQYQYCNLAAKTMPVLASYRGVSSRQNLKNKSQKIAAHLLEFHSVINNWSSLAYHSTKMSPKAMPLRFAGFHSTLCVSQNRSDLHPSRHLLIELSSETVSSLALSLLQGIYVALDFPCHIICLFIPFPLATISPSICDLLLLKLLPIGKDVMCSLALCCSGLLARILV